MGRDQAVNNHRLVSEPLWAETEKQLQNLLTGPMSQQGSDLDQLPALSTYPHLESVDIGRIENSLTGKA